MTITYRITTISKLDGKATTKVFKGRAEAVHLFDFLTTGVDVPLFATLWAHHRDEYGDNYSSPVACFQSATAAVCPPMAR